MFLKKAGKFSTFKITSKFLTERGFSDPEHGRFQQMAALLMKRLFSLSSASLGLAMALG